MGSQFKEIEHKYIVPEGFSRADFIKKIKVLNPKKTSELQVTDVYFILNANRDFVYRYRADHEIEQLTAKSVGGSLQVRREINLNLRLAGSLGQEDAVNAFLETLGVYWSHRLTKDLMVAYFDDCEIVHYRAVCGDRRVECIEFEAIGDFSSDQEAFAVLSRYEALLGFQNKLKGDKSLFELLLLPDAPKDVINMFKR
jgi:hypothetical protein